MSRRMHRLPRTTTARSATVGVLLSTLLLAGCSGGGGPDGSGDADDTSPTTTTSQSPTATPSAEPTGDPEEPRPEPPRAKDTAKSRKQFAEFVIASWSHALRTNDFKAVTGLSPRRAPCAGCAEFRDELEKRRKQGWFVDYPGTKIKRLEVGRAGQPGTYLASAKVNIPESRSYFDDGAFRNDNAAHRGATFQVRMRLDEKRYTLLAFRVT